LNGQWLTNQGQPFIFAWNGKYTHQNISWIRNGKETTVLHEVYNPLLGS
jgi:hypothetical protein